MIWRFFPPPPFGIPFATQEAEEDQQLAGSGIMDVLVHSANVKYALIRVSREPGSPGPLVIAYPDERSLCALIAEPSIIARGFAHPQEAEALVADNSITSTTSMGTEPQRRVNDDCKSNHRFPSSNPGFTSVFGGCTYRGHVYNALQLAFASAVLVLYSKNFMASIIRTALGI